MRVCHVSPHLPPDQAANALLPAELGRWAAARGRPVTFVSYAPAQGRLASDDLPGRVWRIARRDRDPSLAGALRLDAWRHVRAVHRALEEAAREADLVHLHSNGLIIEAAAGWARRRRLPIVLTLYGTEIWHYRKRRPVDLFTRAYRAADEVTFYSRRLLDRARELGLDRPNVSVIYPPVPEAFFARDETARRRARADLGIAEPLVVLNVKRLHELAGQRFLIDAFARVARGRDDVRLVICGTGPLKAELETAARDAGVAAKITFAGLVPHADVARYAAAADVFVLPSLLEALPTVAVEALASGTPVISADHPGGLELHEIFGDDLTIVPRRQVEPLADAIGDALRTPRRVHPRTLELVGKLFSPAEVDRAYEAVYERARRTPPTRMAGMPEV